MNKKGFTLAELLVAIVILGIISGLSIPVIRGLQASQSEKRYSIYVDSVNSAAKLYTDSYSEDLFEGGTSGCAYIRYKDMSKYRLLKDIDISGISCNTNYTFVKVVRFNDKYFYKPYIGCGAKTGNAVKAEIFKPTKPTALSVCNGSGESKITITAAPDKSESRDKKKVDLEVKLISETGVKNTPPELDYGFSRDNSTNVINGWTRLNFNIPKETFQENMISQSKTQVFSSNTITTPMESGVLYLVIRVTKLMDLAKQPWKKSAIDEHGRMISDYVIVGPYLVDNTPPNFNDSRVISSSTVYNTKTPKLDLKVTDNLSGESDLRMCYAYDGDPECPTPKDGEDLKKLTGYEPYNKSKVLKKIANTFDGNNHNLRIWVSDAAGNVAVKPFTYTVSKSFKLTFNTDGGNACSVGGPINQIENKLWKENIVTNEDAFKNHTFCKTNKPGYTSNAWYTAKNGAGTKVTGDSLAKANLTVYPNWTPKKVTVTFVCPGGRGGGTQTFTYGESGQKFDRPCYKEGYTQTKWTLNDNGTTREYSVNNSVSNAWIDAHSPKVTLTAVWTLKTYTITYNLGGGSVSGNPRNYTIETTTFTLKNPTREGYNFQGWTGTGLSSATKTVTISKGSTGNRTYNANWNPKPVYITYNANGGTGTMSKTTCYYGQNCTAAANRFTYTGRKFAGWYSNAAGTGNSYTTFRATGDIALYAKWDLARYTCSAGYYLQKSGTSCTICTKNYYCPGGTYEYNTVRDQGIYNCPTGYGNTDSTGKSKAKDCYMNVPENRYVKNSKDSTSTPCANGYERPGTAKVYYESTNRCSPKTYSITYNLNGGRASGNPRSYTVETSNIVLNNPTFTGYRFTGWTGTGVASPSMTVRIPRGSTGNRTYTAHKQAINYTLTYNSRGGTECNSETKPYGSTWGPLCTPTRQYYTFMGWSNVTSTTTVTGNVTATANWKYNECTSNVKWNQTLPTDNEIRNNGNSPDDLTKVTTERWEYHSKSCRGSNPYRQYKFKHILCRCKIDRMTKIFCGETEHRDVTSITHPSGYSRIYYRPTDDGRESCRGENNVNSYVTKVCTNGDVTSSKPVIIFHGYKFFWEDAESPYTNFSPNKYWTHTGGEYNDRVESTESATNACKKACEVTYD